MPVADLSVLICSTHTRWKGFGQAIQDQVWEQLAVLPAEYQERIEILFLADNKVMMLGQKRNVMVDMAQGRYVVFVDDDDRIAPDYMASLLDATVSDADVITFLVSVSLNGDTPKLCRYSKDFPADRNTPDGYERLPNHICAVKRELASQVSFPSIAYGEDSAYSKLLQPLLHTEHHIPRVLYHYDYSLETTEAQEYQRAALRRRRQPPVVDIVMMSNAKDVRLKRMTQNAVNTCIAGANSLPVNVIVMEQQAGCMYQHATTISAPGEFNYNAFANRGAQMGTAPWVMVANNDLVFHDGWLHRLLAADHPVVSPKSPGDIRQAHITENFSGFKNAQNFSGWCFMLRRSLWEKIGGFDPDFAFWCADDSVIEQLRLVGVEPMLVPGAEVKHLGSITLNTVPEKRDELTWHYVDLFNHKYDRDKFADDRRYQQWKATHVNA